MTALRLIPLALHGALEMLVGFFLMTAPIALGASPAGAALGLVVGAVVVGVALSSVAGEHEFRRPMTVAAHHALDHGLVVGLLGAAVVLGAAGDRVATVLLAAAAFGQLLLSATTRYSLR